MSVRPSVNLFKRRFRVFVDVLCLGWLMHFKVLNENLFFRCWISLIFYTIFTVFWTFFKSFSARSKKLTSQLHLEYFIEIYASDAEYDRKSLIFYSNFTVFFYFINVKVLRLALAYVLYLQKFKC